MVPNDSAPRVTQQEASGGPGPGQYPIRSSVGDTFQFSMRGREKFGAPTGKSDDPTTGKEPGPGQYPKVCLHKELLLDIPLKRCPVRCSYQQMACFVLLLPYLIAQAIEFLHSEEPTPPAFSVPRSVRPGLNKADRGVRAGPGKPLVGSCGKQVESKKSTQGFAVFGSSKRKPLQEGGAETGPGE